MILLFFSVLFEILEIHDQIFENLLHALIHPNSSFQTDSNHKIQIFLLNPY